MVKDIRFDDQAAPVRTQAATDRPDAEVKRDISKHPKPRLGYFRIVSSDVVVRGLKVALEQKYGKVEPVTVRTNRGATISRPPEHTADDIPAPSMVAIMSKVGVRPGERISSPKAKEVLKQLALTATDLFETPAEAETYLDSADIDGAGARALDLIESGRTASVLARFAELRYGAQG
jgi:hypothetical protein